MEAFGGEQIERPIRASPRRLILRKKAIAGIFLALMLGPFASAATAGPACDAVRDARNAIGFHPPSQGDNGVCDGGVEP